jgi:2-amino-4-hydroxy-6-hydroxymethyldihydropteridine diphosphokinase
MQKHSRAAIGLGSNQGAREQMLREALVLLTEHDDIALIAVSSAWETAPMYVLDQPDFLNACALLQTSLSPQLLLMEMMHVEQLLGRVREIDKGPRTIDLDLLLMDQQIMIEDDLTLPHPALDERPFVLAPLAEIAPGWVHPVLDLSVEQLLEECPGVETLRRREDVELDPLLFSTSIPAPER